MVTDKLNPKLSDLDKKILVILSKLILEIEDNKKLSNIPEQSVVLSDQQATELLDLLRQLTERKSFIEADYFISKIFHYKNEEESEKLKQFYLSRMTQNKENYNNMSFSEFLVRIGKLGQDYHTPPFAHMKFDEFIELEKKLFAKIDLDPRVQKTLIKVVESQREKFNEIRFLKEISIKSAMKGFMGQVKQQFVNKNNLGAAAVIVSNLSVFFSGGDNSVMSIFSSLSGAAATIVLED